MLDIAEQYFKDERKFVKRNGNELRAKSTFRKPQGQFSVDHLITEEPTGTINIESKFAGGVISTRRSYPLPSDATDIDIDVAFCDALNRINSEIDNVQPDALAELADDSEAVLDNFDEDDDYQDDDDPDLHDDEGMW